MSFTHMVRTASTISPSKIERGVRVLDNDTKAIIRNLKKPVCNMFEPAIFQSPRKGSAYQWHNLTQADFARFLYIPLPSPDSCIETGTATTKSVPPSLLKCYARNEEGIEASSPSSDLISSRHAKFPSTNFVDLTGDDRPGDGIATMKSTTNQKLQRTSPSSVSPLHLEPSLNPSTVQSRSTIDIGTTDLEDTTDLDNDNDVEILGEQALLESGLFREPDLQLLQVEEPTPFTAQSPSHTFLKRNKPIVAPWEMVERLQHKKLSIGPKMTVELFTGDFLLIKDIVRNTHTNKVVVRGYPMQRCKDLNAMLERKLNELCLFMEIDLDDPREPAEQSVVDVPVCDITKIRDMKCTNYQFPNSRNFPPLASRDEMSAVFADGGLTLRWKYICTYRTAADRHDNIYKERALEHINQHDVFVTVKTEDAARRVKWRGETKVGGSHVSSSIDNLRNSTVTQNGLRSTDVEATICSHKKRSNISTADFSQIHVHKKPRICFGEHGSLSSTIRRLTIINLDQENNEPSMVSTVYGLKDYTTPAKYSLPTSQANEAKGSLLNTPSIISNVNMVPSTLSLAPTTGQILNTNSIVDMAASSTSVFKRTIRKYTYGDAFCGAGGATRGALMAGLHIKWGFDFNYNACNSWRANFPTATCYNMASDEFVRLASCSSTNPNPIDVKVDVLHLSPPCQFFSTAHTTEGVNDEQNVASMFAVSAVIAVSKPRIVTLEQTFGIMSIRHRTFFAALIHMFTALHFSLRWAIVALPTWGLPQRRNRLIIIAACPGETLPPIPAPTHSLPFSSQRPTSSSLPHPPTVSQALSIIPPLSPYQPSDPHHAPHLAQFSPSRQRPPWNAHQILPRAMTTSGGQNYHPSGTRDLTKREYACLQGFPLNHVFGGKGVKRQIGNAVPPVCAMVLFGGVRRALEKNDQVEEEGVVVLD